jgi:hypothetical protein
MNGSARNPTGTKSSLQEITNLPLTSPFNANRFEFVLEGNDHLIEFQLIEIVIFQLIESFNNE